MKQIISLTIIIAWLLPACNTKAETKTANEEPADSVQVKLIYLGTAGWEITDGKTVIPVDPYLSRIRRNYSENSIDSTILGHTRVPVGKNDFAVSDTIAINKLVKQADYILVHHSHWDHIMDVPFIARKTGATVIGHESTATIMRAYGIADEKIITLKGGEDYEFENFSVKIIPGLHSPLNKKRYYDSRIISKEIKAPLRINDFAEGGSLLF